MDPLSLLIGATLGVAAASSVDEDQLEHMLRMEAWGQAWADFMGSQHLTDADRVRYDQAMEQGELPPLWEWTREYDGARDREVPAAKPPFETLYGVYIEGNVLVGVFENSGVALSDARYRERDEGTIRVDVVYLTNVPYADGVRLLNLSEPEKTDFYDGYEASSFAAQYVLELEENVYSYNMREDDEFDEWDEENQGYERARILDPIERGQISVGQIFYTSDNFEVGDRWSDPAELEWLMVTPSREEAVRMILESGWSGEPRLVTVRVTEQISDILVVPDGYVMEQLERVLGQDFDDSEDMEQALAEHVPDAQGVFYGWRVLLRADGVESLELVSEEPLLGNYGIDGRLEG